MNAWQLGHRQFSPSLVHARDYTRTIDFYITSSFKQAQYCIFKLEQYNKSTSPERQKRATKWPNVNLLTGNDAEKVIWISFELDSEPDFATTLFSPSAEEGQVHEFTVNETLFLSFKFFLTVVTFIVSSYTKMSRDLRVLARTFTGVWPLFVSLVRVMSTLRSMI